MTGSRGELDFVQVFRERVRGDTRVGYLAPPAFLAALLDWHLNRYFRSVETLEERIDAIEETMLKADLDEEVLPLLTHLRGKVSQLRSVLAPQRAVFADRGLLFVHRKGWL